MSAATSILITGNYWSLAVIAVLTLTLGLVVTSDVNNNNNNNNSGAVQAGVHLMLNGVNYTNNSYIPITEIGEFEQNGMALHCVTNNTDCCGLPNRAGEWYYPNGSAVRIRMAGDDFFRDRDFRTVRLNRINPVTSPTGLYHCEIPDSNGVNQTLYVYIGLPRVESVAVSILDGDQFDPIQDPSANVTLTCIITVDSRSLTTPTHPLNVVWSGPVYGTGRFTINKLVNISQTMYASIAKFNSPGAYYDSGEYECRADTTTGSTIVLFQVPHRPSVSTSNGVNWLHLTWTQDTDDVVTSYQLSYSYSGSCDYYTPSDVHINTIIEREYNITGLQEYSDYFITLTASNETGRSPPFEGTFTTQQSVPTGSPQSFNTTSHSTNITIQWGRINCLEQNSEITHYTIRYGASTTNSSERITATVYGTSDNERAFTANRLEPLTNYTFEVAGVNRDGQWGPYSSVVESVTLHPEIISIQLQVHDVFSCLHWRDTKSFSKIYDIVSSTTAAVNEICPQCNITNGDFIEPFLMCFPQSVHQVTFRAQLKDRRQARAREIVTYIEEWINSSNVARLTANGVRLSLNNTCVVLLSTIDDLECPGYLSIPPTTRYTTPKTTLPTINLQSTNSIQTSNTTGVIIVGGVIATVFLVSLTIAVTILGVFAILKCHRIETVDKRKLPNTVNDLRNAPPDVNEQQPNQENEVQQQGPRPEGFEMDNATHREDSTSPRVPNNDERQNSSVCYVNQEGLYATTYHHNLSQMEMGGMLAAPVHEQRPARRRETIEYYDVPD